MLARLVMTALALVSVLGRAPAMAQSADPERIMLEVSDALARTEGFVARVTLKGEGSALITSTMPALSGRFTLGAHPEHGLTLHAVGEVTERKGAEPEAFEFMRSGERLSWTDHARSRVTICHPDRRPKEAPSALAYLLTGRFVGEKPLGTLLGTATAYTLEDRVTIDGVECDVVGVTLPDPQRGESRSHGVERWSVGVEDRLPRRIEQITDAGIIKATLIVELTSLRVSAPAPDDLENLAPENYAVRDLLADAEPEPEPVASTATPGSRPASAPARDPMAPPFTLETASGATISNATQRGRVTLLAFGGSWCIPCLELVPALSELATAYADRGVDVVYAAVRERDPEGAYESYTERGAAARYVKSTPGVVTNAFRVRIYPTLVVIDAEGRIRLEAHLDAENDAAALVSRARDALEAALEDAP